PPAGTVVATYKHKTTNAVPYTTLLGATLSWKLYDNPKCEGQALAADGPVAVSGNGDYATPQGAPISSAGTYYWVASYSGDHNNKEAASGSADEPVTDPPSRPPAKTTPS